MRLLGTLHQLHEHVVAEAAPEHCGVVQHAGARWRSAATAGVVLQDVAVAARRLPSRRAAPPGLLEPGEEGNRFDGKVAGPTVGRSLIA